MNLPTHASHLAKSPLAQMLICVGAGIALGLYDPQIAMQVKPFSDVFVRLIALAMNPIIFCMMVSVIAGMRYNAKLSGTGARALVYFAAMTMLSLVCGLLAMLVVQPGAGFGENPTSLMASVSNDPSGAKPASVDLLLHLIPSALSIKSLYVLLAAAIAGLLLANAGKRGDAALIAIDKVSAFLFKLVHYLLKIAPLAAFSAMAFTIGKYGASSLLPLMKFIVAINVVSILFVVGVLGYVASLAGMSIRRFTIYILEELYIVFFTSSSLAALPRLSEKLERLGCPRSVVGLVLPSGYSLNLVGTNLYIVMAVLFLVQTSHIDLGWEQLLTLLAVCLVTTKSAVGITGSGFATLTATLAILDIVPVEMAAMLLGIDRTMKCRSIANVIGNGVACVAVSAWEKNLDLGKLDAVLGQEKPAEDHST